MTHKPKHPNDKALLSFIRAHYYCDDNTLWQPFEHWTPEQVDEQIDDDLLALKLFLNKHYNYPIP